MCETKPIASWKVSGREPVLSLPKERPTHEEPRGDCATSPRCPASGNKPDFWESERAWRPKCAKQSQTWANWGIWATACVGVSVVRNEANLAIADFRNGTGQPASALGGVVGLRIEDCGLGTNLPPSAFLWAGCPNKPNSRRAECVLRA
jgi:hypothetical protein